MKKTLFIISILLFINTHGQKTSHSDSIINSRVNLINIHLKEFENKIESERTINDKTFNSISTQISAASLSLGVMGIVFGILAIIVGVYVTYVERKIIKIGEANKDLLLKNQKIKDDVEELNKLIQNDIQGLFDKLKRQETLDLLERLQKVPEDISNICTLLLSRELQNDDFDKLKNAYQKIKSVDESYKNSYKLLFFQHFLTPTLKDGNLKKEILEFIPLAISAEFENDILKSTHDFIVAVIDDGINNFKNETNKFFQGLGTTEHKDFLPIYKTLFDSLKTRQNRFDFLNLIETTNESKIPKVKFGKLLIEEYSQFKITETESLAFNNINEIEAQILQEDDEAKKSEEAEKVRQEQIKNLNAEGNK